MQSHNDYLKQLETYLTDLPVMEKNKILSEVYTKISEQSTSALPPVLKLANEKRQEHGHQEYHEKKKPSFFSFFLKLILILGILFTSATALLVWKFTPLIKVDEKNNRIVLLGGLIDLDGKAGKFKIVDDYHFSHDQFSNDLQANILLEEDKDEIILKFQSGSFQVKNSTNNRFNIDCKLSGAAKNEAIDMQEDFLQIDLSSISGLKCDLEVPEDKKMTIEGKHSSINIIRPEFNLYIELENGKVAITPEEEIDYLFDLKVDDGYIGEFNSNETDSRYEIQIKIDKGSIIRK